MLAYAYDAQSGTQRICGAYVGRASVPAKLLTLYVVEANQSAYAVVSNKIFSRDFLCDGERRTTNQLKCDA